MSREKRQIVDGLFQENLYHVVRGERRSKPRPDARQAKRHRRRIKIFASTALLINITAAMIFYIYINKRHAADVIAIQEQAKAEVALQSSLEETLPGLFASGQFLSARNLDFNLSGKPFNINEINFEDGSDVNYAQLFGLRVSTIVIDPGHGGKDPGAVTDDGSFEKDIVLAVAQKLRERLLLRGNYTVLMTRHSDQSVSLQQRVEYANSQNTDLFVSLHLNSFPEQSKNFIETYYFGNTEDEQVTRLAELENTDSDYHYAEFNLMIQHISDTMKYQESKRLAEFVQQSLYSNVKRFDRSTSNHGIKPGPFVVLLGLKAPAILAEVANLTSHGVEKRLKSSEYQDRIAKFLENGIVNYLNNTTNLGEVGNGTEKKDRFQEAFNRRETRRQ